jgi:hypothetical protein
MQTVKYLNAFRLKERTPDSIRGFYVRFQNLNIEKQTDRRAFLQSIVGSLCRRGVEASVAPTEVMDSFDIAVLTHEHRKVEEVLDRFSNLSPQLAESTSFDTGVIQSAWQNRCRIQIVGGGFIKTGERYILKEDIVDGSTEYKRCFRVQASLVNGYPIVWVDARTRIMRQLSEREINEAEAMGEESYVKVRVLPSWQRGLLVGRTGKSAKDMEFPHGGRMLKIPEYWKVKHGIDFVREDDEMLDVFVPSFGRTLPYPRSCVYGEYGRTKLPESLKKEPDLRIRLAKEFVETYLTPINFLGRELEFEGPLSAQAMGLSVYAFPSHTQLFVVVGSDFATPVDKIHSALRKHGPYAGKLNGTYIVVHSGHRKEVQAVAKTIEHTYANLNLGTLQLLTSVGDGGFIDAGGETATDFTSAIAALRSAPMHKGRVLALIILPSLYAADIYFKSRDQLFERIFGTEPFPCQAVGYETVEKVLSDDKVAYAISANIASQCYVKFGGTGTAVWILQEPADCKIPGIPPGSSCYAYHDVSRRPKLKASATAYSALTDSYGRYIATGTKPVGGERLAPTAFYDIIVELIQKVSIFSQRYLQTSDRRFKFGRLVFAKDGVIRDDEADMMENVIMNGLPEENKEPVSSLLKRIPMFPKSIVIDIIGVNKTPNKRIFDFVLGHYANVREGTAIPFNENEGVLVTCSSKSGSVQPLEISLKKHICLNSNGIPRPHIQHIMDEYYRLTVLNWASLFRQGKLALPQILTQNLGENISYGVRVPDDMILL